MSTKKLPVAVAATIYGILVEECRAPSHADDLRSFTHEFSLKDRPTTEWRFQGALGFGGKFWFDIYRRECPWRVSCYRENETAERLAMIERANKRLADYWNEIREEMAA